MSEISIVIITKNEAKNIIDCIASALQVSNDIIVADNGSNDDTVILAEKAGAAIIHTEWKGYGPTKNEAAGKTKYDWILSIDADERVTQQLANSIAGLNLSDETILYGFKRESFLGNKKIKFGEWGRDKVYRLYNRKYAGWNDAPVHESITGNSIIKRIIPGALLHYTKKDFEAYESNNIKYAQLSAHKYAAEGKKATFIKRFISPVFSFIVNYFLRLGFLDGKEGLMIAYNSSGYTFLKYKLLHQLQKKNN